MKVITIEDNLEFLRQISSEVKPSDDISSYIKILEEYSINNNVLAMASVQLGIPKRIIYLKNTNLELVEKSQRNDMSEEDKKYNEAKVMINPVITKREGLTEFHEACASCLDNLGRVYRPYKIYVTYYDTEFNIHNDIFEGFPSTVISHEMDHLDGILHIDIAEEVLYMNKEERKKYRITHPYKIYEKTGDFVKLKKNMTQKDK